MIRSFQHRGLALFFATGSCAGIRPEHAGRLRLLLGRWSVSVSGNWRVTFAFNGEDAVDVDYEDYH